MSIRLSFISLLASILFLAGCGSLRPVSVIGNETDDVYFSSSDAKLQENVNKAEEDATEEPGREPRAVDAEDYEAGRDSKHGRDEDHLYAGDLDPYEDDDFYFSRRVRRFTTNSWGYYDPYFAYDPYFVMGTTTWAYYANDPWFYDPFFYNGPSYSWTFGWGYPSWYYLPYQSFWYNPWAQPFGSSWGWYSGWYGGPGGFGYYGYNPYCPPGLFYGGGNGGWNGNDNNPPGHVGPRPSPSSMGVNNLPGKGPATSGGTVRPYQDQGEVSDRPVVNERPVKSKPEVQPGKPSINPVQPIGRPDPNPVSRPSTQPVVKPNVSQPKPDVQDRPNQVSPRPTPKPRPQDQETRPMENPKPRPQYNSRPEPSPSFNRPAPSSNNPGISRPSGNSTAPAGKPTKR